MKKLYLKGVKIKQIIGYGEIYDDIFEVVKFNKIDFIVMGFYGVSGFKEMFIGSNIEKVVCIFKILVLVIKNEYKKFEVKDFVFVIDFLNECKKFFEVV